MNNDLFFQVVMDFIPVGLFPEYNFCHVISDRECFIEIGNISIHRQDGEFYLRSDAFSGEGKDIISENFTDIKDAARAFFFLLKIQKEWTAKIKNLI